MASRPVLRAEVFAGLEQCSLLVSFDAGVPLRDVQEAASHADHDEVRQSGPAAPWTGMLPTSSPPISRVCRQITRIGWQLRLSAPTARRTGP
jgi:hypothetical protein